jgi:hypothetical protein
MRTGLHVVVMSGALMTAFCAGVNAQQLPKSGSISFHTGWKDTGGGSRSGGQASSGARERCWCLINDRGTGPLHLWAGELFLCICPANGTGKSPGSLERAMEMQIGGQTENCKRAALDYHAVAE